MKKLISARKLVSGRLFAGQDSEIPNLFGTSIKVPALKDILLLDLIIIHPLLRSSSYNTSNAP
jgi:hypothetical protein